MTCIECGTRASAIADINGIEAAFCCFHIPFSSGAKVKMFAVC